jgi:putative phosphoesterase
MKKILIISDTHKNQVLLRKVLSNEKNIPIIFHLGDCYEDLDPNTDLTEGKEIIKVPGIFHEKYLNKKLSAVEIFKVEEWSFLLVHNLPDAINKDFEADIYLFGHTHKWFFEKRLDKYYLNPGHLKNENDSNNPPSYAVIEISKTKIDVKFKYPDGKTFFVERIEKC